MELRKKAMKPKHDSFKSDVYSMGMLLLQAATLKNVNDCYDRKRFCIRND